MINSTHDAYFTLSAYIDIESFQSFIFLLIVSLYMLIICSNLLLIVVICVNRSLHEPMYMFLCSLFVNELYGSTGLFPLLLLQILSDIHTVSASACFLQIFCLYSYGGIEFFNLAVMSYDRYLAICHPLQYNTRMTSDKVILLIAMIWFPPFVIVFVTTVLSASLQLCGRVINAVYCDNHSIIQLACYDTTVTNIYELIVCPVIICGPVSLILYSYMKILRVCFSGCKQTRRKAISTCTPHLASLLNFTFGAFFEVMQGRFDVSSMPDVLGIFLSLYVIMCQPLLSPVMYGLNMTKVCVMCKRFFSSRNTRTK